ncbi:hypothetical protein EV363DRAFT_1311809 [Boletus edulis]|nr:hypothetical protein EV363DRAFT_1311809 [Boletus edulis]
MASNPLIICNPETSWYDFTYTLSWSNECEVAEVLSDIPFISVGILVLGVSALFLVMKRVSVSAVWLFFSTLLAFVAALLDLGHTLADGMATNITFTTNIPVIRTREVLFALSTGFRFMFYWSCVAEAPRKDLSAVSTQTVQRIKFLSLDRTREPHSGSWMRLGLPGKLLGGGLLVAIINITALQIVWRVVPRFHHYGNVYGTDVALELLASFLLLLRMLSNTLTLNSPANMFVHTFKECLAPICGLLVNIAIGVGNLLCFAFTESTVGRLLQAFEVYVIVVFVAVTAFLRHRDIMLSTASLQGRNCRGGTFTLPEPTRESTFRITLPFIETPRMSTILGNVIQSKESSREVLRFSPRHSLNHVSSWVSSRLSRNRARREDEEVRLWNVEKVKVDLPYTGNIDTEQVRNPVSLTQDSNELARLRDASVNRMSITSALDAQSALARSTESSIYGGQILHSRTEVLQRTIPLRVRSSSVSVSSLPSPISSGVHHRESMTATPRASPVYGLTGIQSLASPSGSRTSLDELLRQQSQLDQSIEALKLFSAGTSVNSSHPNSVTDHRNVELTRSPSTGQRTVSSEVSLSNFPVPPWLTVPIPSHPSPGPPSIKRIRGNRRARLAAAARSTPVQDAYTSVSPTVSASSVDIPSSPRFNSIPHSPFGDENESLSAEARNSSRSDSGGTRYNVTSFIGGLATPNEHRQGNREKPSWPKESEPSVEPIQTSSGVKQPPHMPPVPRRLEGLSATPAVAKLSSLARSSGLSRGDIVNGLADVAQYRTNDRALPVALPLQTAVTDHAEKDVAKPPSPQLVRETGLPMTVLPEGTDRVQRIFVRPRPPPLTIHSYKAQSPSITRVQVLADD